MFTEKEFISNNHWKLM